VLCNDGVCCVLGDGPKRASPPPFRVEGQSCLIGPEDAADNIITLSESRLYHPRMEGKLKQVALSSLHRGGATNETARKETRKGAVQKRPLLLQDLLPGSRPTAGGESSFTC